MNEASPITLYTADTPNGQKISIFLKEAGIGYEVVKLNLSEGRQHSPQFLAINPNGKIPAIVDHQAGISIFESAAILGYLSQKYGRLQPDGAVEQLAVQQWLFFQVGAIGPMLGQLWWFLHASTTRNEEAITRYRKEALRLYGVVDRQLAERSYLASDQYSIADIAAFPWLRTYEELALDITPYPHVLRWLKTIESRPAVQAGLAESRDTPIT
ncbi:glutathione S-transferase N-terminal domain-containing protein [Pseudomonas sp. SWRI102]|uniref:Glutathione S-transferase N-terminal domain-containing protein n=1 Tax=Pseudomonas marvdashtae TaxID=2745500 RepID=A0A923FST5_9PSED|nr:glutathione binding-like protein [Pseudomonas marvdashtae]MBV4553771.1 glutathione S-transferase N-terminal domain-containing protein [Pseudomonas marvdashtae]